MMPRRPPAMRHTPRRPGRAGQRGVALLEALIAILILAIGLIGTLGLQVNSQAALAEASMRAEATIAANELIGVMNNDLDHLSDYAVAENATPGARLQDWHAALAKHLPNASVVVAVTPAAGTKRTAVEVEIRWRRNATAQQNRHRIVTYLSRAA
jgi:type IV pilus assembly protein PilV